MVFPKRSLKLRHRQKRMFQTLNKSPLLPRALHLNFLSSQWVLHKMPHYTSRKHKINHQPNKLRRDPLRSFPKSKWKVKNPKKSSFWRASETWQRSTKNWPKNLASYKINLQTCLSSNLNWKDAFRKTFNKLYLRWLSNRWESVLFLVWSLTWKA